MRKLNLLALTALFAAGAANADEMNFPKLTPADIPGAPNLSAPFLVMAGDKPVLTEKHGLAAPALWDWNGDGKRDLLVGEFETITSDLPMGADGSTIRVYLNVGTDSAPEFTEQFEWARDTEGAIMEVPQWCCIGFTPMFYDLNDDGYQDLITGQYHPGEVTWFRGSAAGFLPGEKLPQEGDPTAAANPEFMAAMAESAQEKGGPGAAGKYRVYDGELGDIGTFDYWVYSSATFGDLDDDGDYDLIVGGSGGLRVSENIGGRKTPSFAMRELLLDINGQPLQTRGYSDEELQLQAKIGMQFSPAGDGKSNPLAVDWDQDGVMDLLVTDGYRTANSRAVSFFRGVKTPDGHRFEPGIDLLPAEGGAKAIPGSGQRVYVDDWNRDGVNDLIIGASVATVNGGVFSDELSWEWEDVNKVESAGKDPGLYPPRPRPTAETMRAMYEGMAARGAGGRSIPMPSDEQLESMAKEQLSFWDAEIGRLYEQGKGYWLTMRHQGRVYVMLGRKKAADAPAIARNRSNGARPSSQGKTVASAAGSAEKPSSPVSIRVDSPVALTAGGSAEIKVQFDMQDGWYIYAPTGRNFPQGMVETGVSFDMPDGLRTAGSVNLPPYRFKGSYDIYSGKAVTWGQRIEATPGASAGEYEVMSEITYQTCKDDLCLPPRTEQFKAAVLLQ